MSIRLAAVFAVALSVTPAAAAATVAAPARRVAVLDFNARWAAKCADKNLTDAQEERCEVLRLFADQARMGALTILRPPAFVVMTRENTAQILKDMGGQCSEGECEVETARLLGASVVVSGEVTYLEGNWIVSLKIHDVATAALLGGGNTEAKSKMEAFRAVRAETERMLRESVGLEGIPAAAAPAVKAPDLPKSPPAPVRAEAAAPPPVVEPVATVSGEAAKAEEATTEPLASRYALEARLGAGAIAKSLLDPEFGPPITGDAGVRLSRRLARSLALEGSLSYGYSQLSAGVGTLAYNSIHTRRLAVGLVWTPQGAGRWSLATEVGGSWTGLVYGGAPGQVDATRQTFDPVVACEVRLDFPMGQAWTVGGRAGVQFLYHLAPDLFTGGADLPRGPMVTVPLSFAVTRRL
jgi:hypothetical protein